MEVLTIWVRYGEDLVSANAGVAVARIARPVSNAGFWHPGLQAWLRPAEVAQEKNAKWW